MCFVQTSLDTDRSSYCNSARLPVSDELRQDPTRTCHPCRQHICQGEKLASDKRIRQLNVGSPQDTADFNPLVRALAIRTMSTLKAEKILTYLGEPLNRCLRDDNPYVRKTAALCVAKAFELKPELCVEWGFIEILRDLVGDGNPMVGLG